MKWINKATRYFGALMCLFVITTITPSCVSEDELEDEFRVEVTEQLEVEESEAVVDDDCVCGEEGEEPEDDYAASCSSKKTITSCIGTIGCKWCGPCNKCVPAW